MKTNLIIILLTFLLFGLIPVHGLSRIEKNNEHEQNFIENIEKHEEFQSSQENHQEKDKNEQETSQQLRHEDEKHLLQEQEEQNHELQNGIYEHQEQVNEQKHQVGVASAAVVAISTEATKFLLNNPQKAAQIPTSIIQGSVDGLVKLFEGSWNIKGRSRTLQLTFSNLLRQQVSYAGDYFDSGVWYKTWTPTMRPGSITQGTVANRQGSFMTGVTGGIKLRIEAGNGKPAAYIYLGFNNPYVGGYKNFGEISTLNKPPKYGYSKSSNNSPKNSVSNGYRLQVVQTQSSIAQMAFVYQLSYA